MARYSRSTGKRSLVMGDTRLAESGSSSSSMVLRGPAGLECCPTRAHLASEPTRIFRKQEFLEAVLCVTRRPSPHEGAIMAINVHGVATGSFDAPNGTCATSTN